MWPATRALFIVQKSNYFYLAAAHVLMYYSHVYRQATWKTYQATAVDQDAIKNKAEKEASKEGKSAFDEKAEETKAIASKSKKGSKGSKSSKKQQ